MQPPLIKVLHALSTRASGQSAWLLTRLILVIITLLFAQGCTNSKLIIGPLYNQLDNQMRKEFNKLGDFNETQTAAFEQTLGTYHVWHRQEELPKYAALLGEISASVAGTNTSKDRVQSWFDTVEGYSRAARECHPVNFSFDLMKSLTDDQLTYIENRFRKQQTKNRLRYEARSPAERVEYRLKRLEKWAGRVDFDFTARQRAMLRTALVNQISLRAQYYRLSGEWNKQLFNIARDQDHPDYDLRMRSHLSKLWSLLESEYPQEWQQNRAMWQDVTHRLISSMTEEQRQQSSRWLGKMGSTLMAISKDEPSFTTINDPSLGCLVSST